MTNLLSYAMDSFDLYGRNCIILNGVVDMVRFDHGSCCKVDSFHIVSSSSLYEAQSSASVAPAFDDGLPVAGNGGFS